MATREEEIMFIMKMRDEASRIIDQMGDEFEETGRKADDAAQSTRSFADTAQMAGKAVAAAFASIRGSGALLNVFAQYEEGMLGIAKTTNQTEAEMEAFSDQFDEMAERLTVPIQSLQEIGITAGQLGIKGTENILKFTETVAKLETATDLTGEAASFALARITTVTGEGVDGAEKLANVIVSLGNSFAATESQILHIAQEVARSTSTFELGSETVAAYGAAFAQLGISAEIGGTSIGRTFRALATAAAEGGDGMREISRLTGLTQQAFLNLVESNPQEAMELFLEGLGPVTTDTVRLNRVLENLGLKTEEINKTIVPLAKQFDVLADAQARAREEAERQTALNTEYEVFAKSFNSNFQLMINAVTVLAKELGQNLGKIVIPAMEAITKVAQSMTDIFKAMPDAIQTVTAALVVLAPAIYAVRTALQLTIGTMKALRVAVLGTGIGALTIGLGALVTWLLNTKSAAETAEGAMDNHTKAMEDQAAQVDALNRLLDSGLTVSENVAQAELDKARARRIEIQAILDQKKALVESSQEFIQNQNNIARLQQNLANTAKALQEGEDPGLNAVKRENLLNALRSELDLRRKLLSVLDDDNQLAAENRQNIAELETAIQGAENGMVRYGDAVDTSTEKSTRIPPPLYEAAGAARALGGELLTAAEFAKVLVANLGSVPATIADLEDKGEALTAEFLALEQGQDLVTAATAKYRKELEQKLGLEEADATQASYITGLINKQTDAFERNLRLQEKISDQRSKINRANRSSGGGGGAQDEESKRLKDFIAELEKESRVYAEQAEAIRLKRELQLEYNLAAQDADRISELIAEANALGYTAEQTDVLIEKYIELARAREGAFAEGQDFFTQFRLQYQEFARSLEDATQVANSVVETLGGTTTNFLDNILDENMNFFDALRSAASDTLSDIGRMLLDHALKVLVFKHLLGIGSNTGLGQLIGLGKGGVGTPSGVQEFASGDAFTNRMFNQPTMFQFGDGQLGVMGEDGDEAVMPLTRDSKGNLAVSAVGASGGMSASMTQMVFNTEVVVPMSGNNQGAAPSEKQRSALGKSITNTLKVTVQEVIVQEMRPGGLLSGTSR